MGGSTSTFTRSRQRIVESREHMGPPPAWYTDSERPNELRYWDGTGWTEHRVSHSLDDALSDATSKPRWQRWWTITGCVVLVVIVIVVARVLTLFGWGANSDAPRVRAAAIERLFTTERVEVGDGVIGADCRPGDDRRGLGNPWACEVETDSSGDLAWTVTVEASGRFRAKSNYPQVPETGMSRGCCVTVRRP